MVNISFIAEKDVEELHQYREQQRKRGRSDSANGSHVQKSLLQVEIRAEGSQHIIHI